MQIKMQGRTEKYRGAAEIDFEANENLTVRLTDGRIVDLFADGSWQAWTAAAHDAATGVTTPAQLICQGDFHPTPQPPPSAAA